MQKLKMDLDEHNFVGVQLRNIRKQLQILFVDHIAASFPKNDKANTHFQKMLQELEKTRSALDSHYFKLPGAKGLENKDTPYYGK